MRVPTGEYAVVVPTLGRPSLDALLAALAAQAAYPPAEVVLVDDRKEPCDALGTRVPDELSARVPVRVLAGMGRGPAAARNLGWQVCRADWVVFLDDDVVVPPEWSQLLHDDLRGADPDVAAVQAQVVVPLPRTRRPTDWERGTAGLATAAWITADMAVRRSALSQVHGFDERFRRAYREDADLALRLRERGWRLQVGRRTTTHPVRPDPGWWGSVRAQRGNADDALMRRLHGPSWRDRAGAGHGRLPWHVATTSCAVAAAVLGAAAAAGRGRARRAALAGATLGAAGWLALTTDFVWRRIAPGPRDPVEVARMTASSLVLPLAATWHRVRGHRRHRRAEPWPPRALAVLLDRDGTLVADVAYNDDPGKVSPLPTAKAALDLLRHNDIRLGVVTNQSGVARGLISRPALRAVNAEVRAQLGPFDTWHDCVHLPEDHCDCRKPRPGMVLDAAAALGLDPADVVVVGDIESDLLAARAAGARAILVPNALTRSEEVADAPVVAESLLEAAELVLGGTL
ncbi:MAG TPA: HAD-IIIA family hydrolase [Pedococcus sp.]|jgi:histidinol-phosphate phosphatase family protein